MNRQYFGTDGVRGPYGGPVINADFAGRLGSAAGRWLKGARELKPGTAAPRVLIGRDTRASGPALEAALAAGLVREGLAPVALGVRDLIELLEDPRVCGMTQNEQRFPHPS